jgi:CheY-like chemotaxis protein
MYVVIADDNEVVRKAICHLLESDPRIAPCIEAANGEEAIKATKESKPDVVVLDLSMPKMSGVEAARRIRKLRPSLPIILCSMYEDMLDMKFLHESGITAVVAKREAAGKLLPVIWALLGLQPTAIPAGV